MTADGERPRGDAPEAARADVTLPFPLSLSGDRLAGGGEGGPFLEDLLAELDGHADPAARLAELCAQHPALAADLRALWGEWADLRGPPRYEPGSNLGFFELVRPLGRGSTGEVWEAVDLRYGAPVALKLFDARPGRGSLDRVMAEARAASRIVHENVVYVRDAGQIEAGGPHYLSMALCRDEDDADARVARSLAEEEPASIDEAARWGEQLARGIAAAHARDVYHRDLKPENALCLPRARAVRILDFGLAPLASGGAAARGLGATRTQTLLVRSGTQARLVAGTPAYMAPEQARGFSRSPDPARDAAALVAMDVYGVGATLWAILVGHPPHARPGEDLPAEAIVQRAVQEPAPDLTRVRARFAVPRRLARIVARAMAFDPADRYASAAALADDLARFRADLPTSLDPAFSPVRPALALRRNPLKALTLLWLLVLGALTARAYREFEQAYARLEEVQALLGAAEGRAAQLGQEVDEAKGRVDAAETTRDAANEKAAQAQSEADRAQREADNARTGEARAEADRAQAEADKAQAEAEAAQAQLDKAKAEAEAAQARLDKATAEASAAQAEAEASQAERDRLDAMSARLQAEAEAESAQRDAAQARSEAQQAREELERWKRENPWAPASPGGAESPGEDALPPSDPLDLGAGEPAEPGPTGGAP